MKTAMKAIASSIFRAIMLSGAATAACPLPGGDDNRIFTRIDRSSNSPQGVIEQTGMYSGNAGAHFCQQEKQDIAAYLNLFYKFQ